MVWGFTFLTEMLVGIQPHPPPPQKVLLWAQLNELYATSWVIQSYTERT